MPLINQDSLTSFVGSGNFITLSSSPSGFDEAVKQSSNIVYQATLIAIPDNIADAVPVLQFIAHEIALYILSFRQILDDNQRIRIREMYNDALTQLEHIKSGKMIVYNNQGEQLNSSSSVYFNNGETSIISGTILPRDNRP